MKTTLLSALCLLMLSGCINSLSNEDLIFLAAIPRPKEVSLQVDSTGTNSGALTSADAVGDPAELYSLANEIAVGINGGVGDLLTMIDGLGRGYPPTERTDDARIWGPISDLDGSGKTLRLEIMRETREDGGPRFLFCLQFGLDSEIAGGAPRCNEQDKNGYRSVLGGQYDPTSLEGGARSGSGEVYVDFDKMQAVGVAEGDEQGRVEITYDFSAGGDVKQIHVDAVGPLDTGSVAERFEYDYGRDANGYVDFSFDIKGLIDASTGNNAESFTITAFWTEGQSGRGDAVGRGGDLQPDQHAALTECWDANHGRTYMRYAIFRGAVEQVVLVTEGDIASCP